MIMDINIYNGPYNEFLKIIPDENIINLSEFIRVLDNNSNNIFNIEIGEYSHLIVSKDEYASVTDTFLERMVSALISILDKCNYESVFFHNPPFKIIQQLSVYTDSCNIQHISYSYKNLKRNHLKRIKYGFDSVIYGQESVKNQILASLYDLTVKKSNKPRVILLYGSPGIGKTETVYYLNKMINPRVKLFRKQFSMFQTEGYHNYLYGNISDSFAKDLLNREGNILLLDEFDKCARSFYSAFYQMFDEGLYIDKNYEVVLRNSIIFCTSNYMKIEEIESHLGSPIFSRIDKCIKYEDFSIETRKILIEQVYREEFNKYSETDRHYLDTSECLSILLNVVNQVKNYREIRKLVQNVIGHILVTKI